MATVPYREKTAFGITPKRCKVVVRLVTDVSPYGPVLPTRSGRSSHANDPLQGLIWTRDNLYNGPRDGL